MHDPPPRTPLPKPYAGRSSGVNIRSSYTRTMRVVVAAGAAGLLLVVLVGVSRGQSESANGDALPDLMQRPPSSLVVSRDGDRFRLGFASAVSNLGPGPLVVVGSRPGR